MTKQVGTRAPAWGSAPSPGPSASAPPAQAGGDGGRQRDEAFLALLRAGDPSAFGLLFDAWADPVYDRLSNLGFTTGDVCELSTDTFASAHRLVMEQPTGEPFRVLVHRLADQQAEAAADSPGRPAGADLTPARGAAPARARSGSAGRGR